VKKIILLTALILINGLCAFAQEESAQNGQSEKKMAAGAGLEMNMNSRESLALGFALGFDYNLTIAALPFAAGAAVTLSSNFSGIFTTELAAMFRWYFLGKEHTGFFAQADIGVYLFSEDKEVAPLFLIGLRGGYRLPFGSMFYVEPYGRLGYPFIFGIGALAGIKF